MHASLFGCFDSSPSLLAERTGVFLLSSPFADAVSVVSMIACTPTNHTCLTVWYFIGLAFQTSFVDTVLTDGTILHSHIPTPQGYSVPLLNLNALIDLHYYYTTQTQRINSLLTFKCLLIFKNEDYNEEVIKEEEEKRQELTIRLLKACAEDLNHQEQCEAL